MKRNINSLIVIVILFSSTLLMSGCDFFEELWDANFNWEGTFDLSEGWQIEVQGSDVFFVTAGNSKIGLKVGDKFGLGLAPEGDGDIMRGYIRENKGFGFLVPGTMQLTGDVIIFKTNSGETYGATKGEKGVRPGGGSTSGTGGTSGTGNGGGTSGTSTKTLLNQKVEGEVGDKKVFRVTVPTGTKKLEVKTSSIPNVYYRNAADLFVRFGSDPIINRASGYTWTADCASVKPNLEDEICVINNPRAGQYNIMLYGYNSWFISHLTVTITQ